MNSKIKVLQVIPKLGYGGAETGCYDLAHFLSENNCRSYLITSGGPLLKYIKKDKVKLFKLPVHSKNPLLMILNSIFITFIILFFNISIVHARSRAPAWSCLLATKLTRRKFVTTFHGTYNFNNSLKKFYNSVMVRSDLAIAGSNFIFSHINENYGEFFLENNPYIKEQIASIERLTSGTKIILSLNLTPTIAIPFRSPSSSISFAVIPSSKHFLVSSPTVSWSPCIRAKAIVCIVIEVFCIELPICLISLSLVTNSNSFDSPSCSNNNSSLVKIYNFILSSLNFYCVQKANPKLLRL